MCSRISRLLNISSDISNKKNDIIRNSNPPSRFGCVMGDLLFQEIQDALCREGKLLPDLGVATFQLLAETTLGPTAYHLTDGFTTGSVATLTAGIEEGELLRELGKEQGVFETYRLGLPRCPAAACRDASQTSPSAWRARSRPQPWQNGCRHLFPLRSVPGCGR